MSPTRPGAQRDSQTVTQYFKIKKATKKSLENASPVIVASRNSATQKNWIWSLEKLLRRSYPWGPALSLGIQVLRAAQPGPGQQGDCGLPGVGGDESDCAGRGGGSEKLGGVRVETSRGGAWKSRMGVSEEAWLSRVGVPNRPGAWPARGDAWVGKMALHLLWRAARGAAVAWPTL